MAGSGDLSLRHHQRHQLVCGGEAGASAALPIAFFHALTQIISVSTPHLAEVWWERLPETEGFVSGSELDVPQRPSEVEALVLSGERTSHILTSGEKSPECCRTPSWGPASQGYVRDIA